jgi:hypothetical protein
MALSATLSASKFILCGRGFQPRSSRLESRSHKGNANLLERRRNLDPDKRVQLWERRPVSIGIAARCRSHQEIAIEIGTLYSDNRF